MTARFPVRAVGRLVRPHMTALVASGLVVLAAALLTPPEDASKPSPVAAVMHPAAETTPNALPRSCRVVASDDAPEPAGGCPADDDDHGHDVGVVADEVRAAADGLGGLHVGVVPQTTAQPGTAAPRRGRAPPVRVTL